MARHDMPTLFWLSIVLLTAWVVMELLSGPPTGWRIGLTIGGAVAVVLLVVDRLRKAPAS